MIDTLQILLSHPSLRFNTTNWNTIPEVGGLDIAFEEGQSYQTAGNYRVDRIVRIGESGNLRERVYNHYWGNNSGSVLRRKMGAAFGNEMDNEIVDKYIRNNITFMVVPVDDRESIKRSLTATLYTDHRFIHSREWLGIKAGLSKLWQSNELNGPVLTSEQLLKIILAVR